MSYIGSPAAAGLGVRSAPQHLFTYGNVGPVTAIIDCLVIVAASVAAGAIIGLEPSQIERPGSPSMTCWRSKGRSPGFQSDAVWTTR